MRPAIVLLSLLICALVSAQEIVSTDESPEQLDLSSGDAQAIASPDEDFDPGTAWVRANTAYIEGNHEEAIKLYRHLIENGYSTAEVYFNLGNALLRNGELGPAVATYRRAKALAPRDEDLEANLDFARRATKDALAPPQPSAVAATLFFWHYGLSRAELTAATISLNFVLWTLLIVRIYRRGSELLRWAVIVVLLVTLAVGGSLLARQFFPTRVAVVLPAEVDALTGPGADSVVRFKLHAGTEVRVKDSQDGWLRVALPDGQQGWMDGQYLEVVSF